MKSLKSYSDDKEAAYHVCRGLALAEMCLAETYSHVRSRRHGYTVDALRSDAVHVRLLDRRAAMADAARRLGGHVTVWSLVQSYAPAIALPSFHRDALRVLAMVRASGFRVFLGEVL